MNNINELVNKLSRDVKKLENKIEHRTLYNIRNIVVKALLKSGIAIDYALPFILATIVIAHSYSAKGNAPFHIDEITENASIETIDTSSGIHLEYVSHDFSYDDELIEYSTGWITNEKGLYERTVTSYRISDEIDLSQTDKILSMSKEEVENILVVTNIQTIRKNTLTPEDKIYDSDALIVVNHSKSEDETINRRETSGENIWNSILFIILSLGWGNNFRMIERLFIKTYIRDRLGKYEHLFRQINKEEIEKMKKLIEVKNQNLAMIDETSNNIGESEGYPYRLRKDKSEENEGRKYVLRRTLGEIGYE